MNHTTSNAGSAMNLCARFIAPLGFPLKGLAFILPISNLRNAALSRTYVNEFDTNGTLSARSLKGFNSRLKGVARELAVAIGILLSMASMPSSQASIDATKSLKVLANKQLTDKQYKCHNEIVYRESRWQIDAVNGSHHGYYQIRSKSVQNKPYDYQFYVYWYYVFSRYGYTEYDEPNYCLALKHLKSKGWQ
jgi:hypothetical protein